MPRSRAVAMLYTTSEVLLPRPGLCSHSSFKACRLLTIVCILLEVCTYALSVDRPNTINEITLVSVAIDSIDYVTGCDITK